MYPVDRNNSYCFRIGSGTHGKIYDLRTGPLRPIHCLDHHWHTDSHSNRIGFLHTAVSVHLAGRIGARCAPRCFGRCGLRPAWPDWRAGLCLRRRPGLSRAADLRLSAGVCRSGMVLRPLCTPPAQNLSALSAGREHRRSCHRLRHRHQLVLCGLELRHRCTHRLLGSHLLLRYSAGRAGFLLCVAAAGLAYRCYRAGLWLSMSAQPVHKAADEAKEA